MSSLGRHASALSSYCSSSPALASSEVQAAYGKPMWYEWVDKIMYIEITFDRLQNDHY